jgi:propionyl-CoA carboxylase beta chain
VEILFKKEIEGSPGPAAAPRLKEQEYAAMFAHPYIAAGRGYIDDVIDPRDTRPRLIDAFDVLRTKRDRNPPKKHGNLPL